MGDQSNGYFLKSDPMKQLYDQELKKQEYAKALKEQMEEDKQRKYELQ